ncbi:hypothetical protein ACHQM5_013588 [Ranunculus cassubicifolius]
MKRYNFKREVSENKRNEEIDWELRPGGMLVQKRLDQVGASGPLIKIKVSHGSYQYEISLPSQSTFGSLKRLLAHETGLKPKEQRLLFKGKEKEDEDCLHMVGVMDMSKVVLMEDPASREKKLQERKKDNGISKACEEIAKVREEVQKMAKKVSALQSNVYNGTKVGDKEFNVLTELLMMQLLKLDSIAADGEAKDQRKIEVRRIQNLVETLDNLKSRNSNPFRNGTKAVAVTTKWQKFESGFGSLSAPTTTISTKITKDWEVFY